MSQGLKPQTDCTGLQPADDPCSWQEIYALLDCPLSIEPSPDPVSSDPIDAAARQTAKLRDGRSS